MSGGIARFLLWTGLVAALTVLVAPAARAAEPAPAWQRTGLTEGKFVKVSTPRSGALYAQTSQDLWRSDDAGDTWRPIPLPGQPKSIIADPHDHTTVYIEATVQDDGVSGDRVLRSRDEGASWQVILPAPGSEMTSGGIIASPAAAGLLYSRQGAERLRRSDDGGDTWVDLETPGLPRPEVSTQCGASFEFYPHPILPEVVYQVGACRASRLALPDFRTDQSLDRGASWSTLTPSPFLSPFADLVACGAEAPNRLYLKDRRPDFVGGPSNEPSVLKRSDDGGQTWRQVRGGEDGPMERIASVVCRPTDPDRVFMLRSNTGVRGLRVSLDGGQTWTDADLPGDVQATSLGMGIDGRFLFLATEAGIWRLPLTD